MGTCAFSSLADLMTKFWFVQKQSSRCGFRLFIWESKEIHVRNVRLDTEEDIKCMLMSKLLLWISEAQCLWDLLKNNVEFTSKVSLQRMENWAFVHSFLFPNW